MYFIDRLHGADGSRIYRTQNFDYPVKRKRDGSYKLPPGSFISVCLSSDFFLKEADEWRAEAWRIMKERSDVLFYILTKRPERVMECLPPGWNDGWENIFFNVTCENQKRADERLPILIDLPFKYKGVMAAPLIGPIDMYRYLASGQIKQVMTGGENYEGARPCDFDWIKSLSEQCKAHDVNFIFSNTGKEFIKDGRLYHLPDHKVQSEMVRRANVNHQGKPIQFKLYDSMGFEI